MNEVGLDEAVMELKPKVVGNSFAIFIPANIKEQMQLTLNENIIVHLHKKKSKNAILSLFGITKGKLGPWIEKEDRLDVRN